MCRCINRLAWSLEWYILLISQTSCLWKKYISWMTIIFEVVIRQNTQYFVNHCVSNGFWSNRDFFIYNLLVCRVVVLKKFDRPVSFYIQTDVFEMFTYISQSSNSYKNQYTFHEKCTPIFLSIKVLKYFLWKTFVYQ